MWQVSRGAARKMPGLQVAGSGEISGAPQDDRRILNVPLAAAHGRQCVGSCWATRGGHRQGLENAIFTWDRTRPRGSQCGLDKSTWWMAAPPPPRRHRPTARATMRCVKHNRRVMLSVLSAVVRPIRTLEGESPVPRSVARCFGRLRRVCGVRTDTTPRFAGLVHVVGRHSTHDSRQREARAMVAWTVVVWR